MEMSDLILIGRIARAHGIKGQVIVDPETDFAGLRFRRGQSLLVGAEDAPTARQIRDVRFHQGRPVIGFEGVETMNDAETLAGAELWVEAGTREPLPDHTFYRHDLVGCDVVDRDGRQVGTVSAVEGAIERSYLIVQGARGEVMIPLRVEIVTVDLPAKRITVDPPEGLLDVNERP
jgi:16S rRNA processing protein RimM